MTVSLMWEAVRVAGENTCLSRRPPHPITYNHCRSLGSISGRSSEKRMDCPLLNFYTSYSIKNRIYRLTCLDNAWTWDKWSWWFYSLLAPYSPLVLLKSHRPVRNTNVWKTTSLCRHGTCGKTLASFRECPLCF